MRITKAALLYFELKQSVTLSYILLYLTLFQLMITYVLVTSIQIVPFLDYI